MLKGVFRLNVYIWVQIRKMNNTLRLLLLFVLLAGVTYWYTQKNTTKTTVNKTDRDFAISDITSVHKIFIADRNGQTATLEKKANHWQYNGKWKASPNAIQNLLNTIHKVQLKYIPPNAALEHIVKDIATNNIKVELYDQAGKNLKTYYVGGVTNDELGTYMIMEGSNNPYVTYMPGMEGSLRVRFILDEWKWRDKTVFEEKMEDIQSVTMEFPKQKSNSFQLLRKEKDFELTPLFETTTKKGTPPKGQVEKFLRGFDKLIAEAFENGHPQRDSIIQQLPFCILTLAKIDGTQKELRLHPIMKKDRLGRPMERADGKLLIERYYANVNQEDLMLIQELVFGKVLWGYDYFF